MRIRLLAIVVAAVIVAAAIATGTGVAHDQKFRSPDLKPRIGLISNEVAVQRLRTAGIVNPRIIRREAYRLIFEAAVGGETRTLSMDLARGEVRDVRNPSLVVVPLGRADRPLVGGSQLRVDRERLADPSRMRDAVATPR